MTGKLSRFSKAAAMFALAAAAVVAPAGPAWAHADLASTEPVSGAVLDKAPDEVLLTFTEKVEVALGGIRLFDGDGKSVPLGSISHVPGKPGVVAVDAPALERGLYVVTFRVVSADSHPIRGALTFRIGPAPADDDSSALMQRLLASEGGSSTVGGVFAVARLAAFAALVVLVGAVVFLLGLWPEGRADRRARRLIWAAWGVLAVSTAAAIGLQGAYAAGLSLGDAVRPSVISGVLDTRFGQVYAVRLVLLALAAPVLMALLRPPGTRPPPLALTSAAAVVGVGLLLTPGLAGHAASGELVGLAVVADVVHLGGVSVWLGGLVVLAALVLPRAGEPVAARVVPRFSTLAFGAVTVILATGVVQSWRQVRSVEALTDTTYGKVLIVKVALFAAMVALGALSRAAVRRRFRVPAPVLSPGPGAAAATPAGDSARRLRRSVAAEVGLSVAVLLAAAILVYTPPARSALAQPFATEVVAEPLRIDVTVDPAKAGPTVMHFYTLTAAGTVQEVQEMTAKLQLPDRDVGPLKIPLQRAGPGHFSAYGFEVPIAGRWELELEVLLDEIDQVRGTATIPIR